MRIYLTTEPFSTPKTGDYDYMCTLNSLLKNSTILKSDDRLKEIYIKNLYDGKLNSKKFNKVYKKLKENKIRKELVKKYFKQILNDPDEKKILWVQVRAPESGFLFFPEDLRTIRNSGIKVVLTVHEFHINIYRYHYKKATLDLIKNSDLIYFFNEIDRKDAIKMGMKTKSVMTKQLRTLYINTIPANKRENGLLYFGLIRPNKGIENIFKLTKLLYHYNIRNPNKQIKINSIYITGKIELDNKLISTWVKYLTNDYNDIIDQDFRVKKPYNSLLNIEINVSDDRIREIANKCKYLYKSDGKGFANNSSSLINLLYIGGVLFTKWSQFTPEYLVNKKSEYYNSILFQDKINTDLLDDKVPEPIHVLYSIKQMDEKMYQNIIMKADKLLKNEYNSSKIIREIEYVINSL